MSNISDSDGENKLTEDILNIINKGIFIKEEENLILKSKTGIDILVVYNISPVTDSIGKIYGMVLSFKDITEKIIKDKELDYITYHDGLTGVYNRNFFYEEIKNIDLEENLPISVIMGDVNGLKLTNAEEMMYKIKMLESKSMKSRTLKIIAKTLYEKSKQDDLHSKNVSKICRIIGESMGMSKEKISELEILGEIHDIGKIGVSESILNKAGKLSSEEWEAIKKHSQIGYHIVSSSNDLSFLGEFILTHHEWYDGSGYPKGLKGEEVPLMARILAIADAYDTMTNYRPYKKTRTKNEAIEELIKYSGSQFDPYLVEIFTDKVIKKL